MYIYIYCIRLKPEMDMKKTQTVSLRPVQDCFFSLNPDCHYNFFFLSMIFCEKIKFYYTKYR